ncbi:vascular-related unknown protein 4-like [Gastrolobium bilobum]|uniref:vascular-related unknown protein 4-like n=1 Tax=Gastrolobium bilobum TaxID=150636 RepID=UPI002AAFA82A|nr:vascular-related unknown protein 4-like [Gastrolobium bilobum]
MSSVSKALSSNDISTEESGWTMYFEDFFNNHDDNHKCSMSFSGVATSSYHVSDASSMVAKKFAHSKQVEEFSVNKNGKRSSFKKRKNIITALVEDALEDTATSPLNSPKEKGNTSRQRDEQKELSFNGRDSDCTELKKRELCVVPFSMVANYLG